VRAVPLRTFFADKVPSIDPQQTPDEIFQLWSIAAFDTGAPEIKLGAEIGSAKKWVKQNDVLLSKIVPHIRRSWVVGPIRAHRQIASGEWIVFRHSSFVPEYLRHFLTSDSFHHQFMGTVAGVGGSLLRARPDGVGRICVPLPSLDEQRRIAAILDQADALRRKRREALGRLNRLGEAIFQGIFAASSDAGKWPTKTVGDLATDIRTGPFGSQLLHSEFTDHGIAVLGIDNAVANEFKWGERRFISAEKYKELRRYTVRPGDVLITIMGTCGRCAIVPEYIETSINTKHLCCITLDRSLVLPKFLHAAFLLHPAILKQLGVQAKGAVMPGLNMGIIKSLSLPLPPLERQSAFVDMIETIEKQRSNYRRQEREFDALFASLQHRAFLGQLSGLRDEYDFSDAERGKFYREGAELVRPLDPAK
jgi:type I restriction enzyme S subunit